MTRITGDPAVETITIVKDRDTGENGFSLTRDDLTSSYTIIRHNMRTYRSAGVLAVVSGRHNADSELKKV